MKEVLIHKTNRCEKYLRENGEIVTISANGKTTYSKGNLKKGVRYETLANLYSSSKLPTRDVSKLMGELFIPNRNNKKHIIHIDGDSKNNNISNLMWGTHKEVKDINRKKFSDENASNNKKTILILDEEKYEFINIKNAIEFLNSIGIKANRDWFSRRPVPKALKDRLTIEANN